MKKLKSVVCLLCMAAFLLTFTGCVESKEDVLQKLTKYVDGREPTAVTIGMEFSLAAVVNDDPADIRFSMEGHILNASKTNSYAEGEYVYQINGTQIRNSAQVYNFEENGKLLTFTHVDGTDYWSRSETTLPEPSPAPVATPSPTPVPDSEESESTPSLTSVLKKENIVIPEEYSFLLLEEETQTLNDTEVYVLTGSIDGETCKNLLTDSLISDALTARLQLAASKGTDLSLINLKNLNFAALTADVTLYLNKGTGALMHADIILSGMNLLITDLTSMLPETIGSAQYNSLTISPIHIAFSDISYEPVTIPTITEDARILAAQATHNPDQGDGSFILQQYKDAVKFTAQSDWTATELGYCFAGFRNDNNSFAVHYELYRDTTAESFIKLVEDGMIPAMEALELAPVSAAADAIGDYQIHTITTNGINVYIACRPLGDSLLGIYVQDSTGRSLTSILPPILETIEEYQLEF